jgi:hypothetical protein
MAAAIASGEDEDDGRASPGVASDAATRALSVRGTMLATADERLCADGRATNTVSASDKAAGKDWAKEAGARPSAATLAPVPSSPSAVKAPATPFAGATPPANASADVAQRARPAGAGDDVEAIAVSDDFTRSNTR